MKYGEKCIDFVEIIYFLKVLLIMYYIYNLKLLELGRLIFKVPKI